MPRSREQIEQAVADAEAWLDELDPASADPEDVGDLRAIAAAFASVAEAERALAEAVVAARAEGRSWARIGMMLGLSAEGVRLRYGARADAGRPR